MKNLDWKAKQNMGQFLVDDCADMFFYCAQTFTTYLFFLGESLFFNYGVKIKQITISLKPHYNPNMMQMD